MMADVGAVRQTSAGHHGQYESVGDNGEQSQTDDHCTCSAVRIGSVPM